VELETTPALSEPESTVLRRAIESVQAGFVTSHPGYESAWRKTATREAADRLPAVARYAPSPRSTRGATRA
jgi:hypothetical protein